ncbi:MAG: DAK2 domain-containing protein, partial [Pseudomonadota bacterium]
MNEGFRQALANGYEHVSAWADLLDRINVFPVPDRDTGRNLVISLAPLRQLNLEDEDLIQTLLMSARGNSGNIGSRFIEGFLAPDLPLAERASRGRDLARASVADPKPGTMLSLFDTFVQALEKRGSREDPKWATGIVNDLEQSVHATTQQLPALKRAKVVDAGALGMFLFFDGFLHALVGRTTTERRLADRFPEMLSCSPQKPDQIESGFCVDAVLQTDNLKDEDLAGLTNLGRDLVTIRQGEYLKIHLHTDDEKQAREKLAKMGKVVRWAWDNLGEQIENFQHPVVRQAIHIMTDAAGSITRKNANELGITLLDSYIFLGNLCVPETHLESS